MRGEGPLLPKLHTLRWYGLSGLGLIEPSVMFMHSSIRKLVIDQLDSEAEELESDTFASYCAAISARMPFLSCLQLGVYPLQIFEKPMVALMKRLPNLREFLVPPFPDLTRISLGLAEVPQMESSLMDGGSEILDELLSQPLAKDIIHLKHLIPILSSCPNMIHFNLQFPYPPAIDDHDIETIAKSWPGLEEFSFCHQPGVLLLKREKRLTLKALSHFSRHCPNLSKLQLYIDATSGHIPDVTSMKVKRFAKLCMLNVGPSPIDGHAPVAYTLAHLCSTETRLSFGSGWGNSDKIDPEIDSTWRTAWEVVKAVLLWMTKMQQKIESLQT
ncbi:hypothetical protein BDP27DRAFT_1448509 [Rhodocollybia butyracea]|uniref:Uncharacterized protein n=1 Tax=Rhodocollybia butyracea TaxID=206335 RepID=A0A9P5U709_9AGAR|nr:hypothetical protein BDP27DRAFT_1448509 [Rhodocollybia butyracea]